MKVGLGFLGGPDIRQVVEIGRRAERAGFDSLWHAETRITRDSVTALAALATATARVRLGSAAINVFTRGAVLTAITWAALAEAAPGRMILGIGPGSPDPLGQQGYPFDHPVSRLREYVEAVRTAWSGSASFEGRFNRLTRLQPEVLPSEPVPVYFCVTGPKALDCAGRMADGVVFNAFMPIAYTRRAIDRLNRAAGGRFRGELAQAFVLAMADSVAEAAARVRPILATYLVFFPNLAAETGLDPAFLERLRETARRDGLEATFGELPDSLIAEHAVVGPAGACKERLAAYAEAGLQLPVLFPDPLSVEPALQHLATG
jgi:5,10-methylenetetrahydromethanopterin reductase